MRKFSISVQPKSEKRLYPSGLSRGRGRGKGSELVTLVTGTRYHPGAASFVLRRMGLRMEDDA